MAEIIYYVAASLDGYIATEDGGVGWLSAYEGSGEDFGYGDFYASIDGIVMGSNSYEQILGFGEWPYRGKPTWVFSRRALPADPAQATVTNFGPVEFLSLESPRKLKRIWLLGGATLAASFRAKGLITDYIVSIMPIILGGGIRLFGDSEPVENLTLVTTKSWPSGAVQLHYRSVPAPRKR